MTFLNVFHDFVLYIEIAKIIRKSMSLKSIFEKIEEIIFVILSNKLLVVKRIVNNIPSSSKAGLLLPVLALIPASL